MPTCPYCHKELLYDDMYDEYNGGNYIYRYYNGHCPNCSRNFKWTERYNLVELYDLEEEEELE